MITESVISGDVVVGIVIDNWVYGVYRVGRAMLHEHPMHCGWHVLTLMADGIFMYSLSPCTTPFESTTFHVQLVTLLA